MDYALSIANYSFYPLFLERVKGRRSLPYKISSPFPLLRGRGIKGDRVTNKYLKMGGTNNLSPKGFAYLTVWLLADRLGWGG